MSVWQVPSSYSNLFSGQKYFIQQWGVETYGRSPLTSLVLRTSVTELLREIADTCAMVESGTIHSRSLSAMCNEILYHVMKNPVLKELYPSDLTVLRRILDENRDSNAPEHWKNVRIAVSSFLKKLDAASLPLQCFRHIRTLIANERSRYEEIRERTRLLIDELVARGYSLRYLNQWGYGVFIRDTEPDFLARFERVRSELIDKPSRRFVCVLKFRLPPEVGFPFEPFQLTDRSILADVRGLDPTERESCEAYFQTGLSYAAVSVEGMDRFGAAEKAHKMLSDRLSLARLVHADYTPGISHDVLVVEGDKSTAWVVDTVNVTRPLRVGNLPLFLAYQPDGRTDAADIIARALHWVRLATDSPREVRFTTLWSALEALVPGRSQPHPLDSIVEAVSSIVTLNIMRLRLNFLSQAIRQRVETRTRQARNEVAAVGLSMDVTSSVALWEAAVLRLPELLALHDSQDEWFKAEYKWLSLALNAEQRSVYRFLEKFSKSIVMSLHRMYRMRNYLAHQAAVDPQGLDNATGVLGHYLNSILNTFIYALRSNPDLTMDELVRCHVWTYQDLLERLRRDTLDSNLLREIVSPSLKFCR